MYVHSDPRRVNATEYVAEQPLRYLAEWYRGTERTGPAGPQRKRKREAFTLLDTGRKPYSCACRPAMIQTGVVKNGDRPHFPAGCAEQRKMGSVPIFPGLPRPPFRRLCRLK